MKTKTSPQATWSATGAGQRGFTLIEVGIATVLLLLGLIALAQLIPMATQSNLSRRYDSGAMVYAQREFSQMLNQPLTATSFTDADGHVCNLGNPATPNTVVGSPVVMVGLTPQINFTAAPVPGYNFSYFDPNDPARSVYEVRWAVITTMSGGGPNPPVTPTVVAKRFIVGAWKRNENGLFPPVTLDHWVQR